jgi:addiction module HigA family antidote
MALTAIHPGGYLAEELGVLDMSAAELARKINVPTNRITQILNGTRAITGDTALRLAHFFGTSAQFWLNATNSGNGGLRPENWQAPRSYFAFSIRCSALRAPLLALGTVGAAPETLGQMSGHR